MASVPLLIGTTRNSPFIGAFLMSITLISLSILHLLAMPFIYWTSIKFYTSALAQLMFIFLHRRNLVIPLSRGGIDHSSILLPVKKQVFNFLYILHDPNNSLENIYMFYLSIVNSAANQLFLSDVWLTVHRNSVWIRKTN